MNPKIIITGRHLGDTAHTELSCKLEKLLAHDNHIVRIRLDLHESGTHHGENYWTAKGAIELRGPTLVAEDTADSLYKAVHGVSEKLDRMLSDRTHRMAAKRRHPHAIDLPVDLPKVIV